MKVTFHWPDIHASSGAATAIAMLSLVLASSLISVLPSDALAAYTYAPMRDVSSQRNLDVAVAYESLHLKSGGSISFFVTVTENGFPVNASAVNFTHDSRGLCTFEYENSGLTDSDGRAVVRMTAYSEKGTIMNVTVTATLEGHMPGYQELREVTIEPSYTVSKDKHISYISITSIIALLIIASTEAGKCALMKCFFLPLYSRLKKDDLLDHFVRGQIYGYIMSHPGEHYNRIKSKLEVTNGTLSHHLRALEFQGFIKSHRDGTYKRFYPTDMKVPRTSGIQISDLQLGILDAIRQSPGISQKDIAAREGISQQTVSYNLSMLERMGVLDSMRDGIRKKYYIGLDAKLR